MCVCSQRFARKGGKNECLNGTINSGTDNDSSLLSTAVKLDESDIATLCNELTSISDWFTLGLNLGVKLHQLHEIHSKYFQVEGLGACRRESLVLWLRRTPSASWRDVVRVLQRMGENTVAGRIERKYIVASKYHSTLQYVS